MLKEVNFLKISKT